MSADRRALHDAFRATTYRATLADECVEIRIAGRTPVLDALLRARGASTWAFVTASNPHATRLSAAENEARHVELARALAVAGFPGFEGESVADDGAWPPERSLLVIGISELEAVRIARRFDQEAIVAGEVGQPARLVFCGAGA